MQLIVLNIIKICVITEFFFYCLVFAFLSLKTAFLQHKRRHFFVNLFIQIRLLNVIMIWVLLLLWKKKKRFLTATVFFFSSAYQIIFSSISLFFFALINCLTANKWINKFAKSNSFSVFPFRQFPWKNCLLFLDAVNQQWYTTTTSIARTSSSFSPFSFHPLP